ncbi:MAG TPA: YceI family protein [Rugosimonospora sp.]|nr:YceI family protein [Rugosimonospora sp.]
MSAHTRRISGAVMNDGWPLPGAAVTVVDAAGRQLVRTIADSRGGFSVQLCDDGHVTVIVTAAGVAPIARTARVHAHGEHDLGVFELGASAQRQLPEPGVWIVDPAHSIVRATARHLALARVEGRFKEFEGMIRTADPIEDSEVSVIIDAASIDTGNSERDNHLRSSDFLDAKQFPTLTFQSSGLSRVDEERWVLGGWLTIRNVTREVGLDLSYLGCRRDPWGSPRMAVVASTQLARNDYEITWNMGLPDGLTLVGPTLRIDIDLQAVKLRPPE